VFAFDLLIVHDLQFLVYSVIFVLPLIVEYSSCKRTRLAKNENVNLIRKSNVVLTPQAYTDRERRDCYCWFGETRVREVK